MAAITQPRPIRPLTGRRYGSFAGKTTATAMVGYPTRLHEGHHVRRKEGFATKLYEGFGTKLKEDRG